MAYGFAARARMIGGPRSGIERAPAMQRFRDKAELPVAGSWKHQCYCGSTSARFYRRAWWCSLCGRERFPIDDVKGSCGCVLCDAMKARAVTPRKPVDRMNAAQRRVYDACLKLAADKASEFYNRDGSERTGSRVRECFWKGAHAAPCITVEGSQARAAYLAGEAFAKVRS